MLLRFDVRPPRPIMGALAPPQGRRLGSSLKLKRACITRNSLHFTAQGLFYAKKDQNAAFLPSALALALARKCAAMRWRARGRRPGAASSLAVEKLRAGSPPAPAGQQAPFRPFSSHRADKTLCRDSLRAASARAITSTSPAAAENAKSVLRSHRAVWRRLSRLAREGNGGPP